MCQQTLVAVRAPARPGGFPGLRLHRSCEQFVFKETVRDSLWNVSSFGQAALFTHSAAGHSGMPIKISWKVSLFCW